MIFAVKIVSSISPTKKYENRQYALDRPTVMSDQSGFYSLLAFNFYLKVIFKALMLRGYLFNVTIIQLNIRVMTTDHATFVDIHTYLHSNSCFILVVGITHLTNNFR